MGCRGIGQDITERKRSEEVLELERRRLEDILQGTNAGTWEWNLQADEIIVSARLAEIIGYTLPEICPSRLTNFMRYEASRIYKAIEWMRNKDMVPDPERISHA